jgi:UDP-N-acetylmuramoyl-L-alanyl-D-glutamate--2,6-diaminopimelate ligase
VDPRRIGDLLSSLPLVRLEGSPEIRVRDLVYDSRRVREGDLFAALDGLHTDGHRFVDQALSRGAAAVLHSRDLPRYVEGVAYLRVPDTREALPSLAASFFHHPSRQLRVIGVTGTDGKSTTVWLLHQLLEALGESSGFLSTVHLKTGSTVEKNPLRQSTPEAPDVQRVLRSMVESGRRYAVLEATSHGLSERTGRLQGVEFVAGALTNISHEHLEFHGTFEQYRSDKANLFRALAHGEAFGVVNLDDPSADYLAAQTRAPVLGYSLTLPKADLRADAIECDLAGCCFELLSGGERATANLGLPGGYNVQNFLAAALVARRLLGVSLQDLASRANALTGVPGRMQAVRRGQPFQLFVDYAHTPRAFEQLFTLVRGHTRGRIIAVFGSAGERDLAKRTLQGSVAARLCDRVILTDEDPRGEDRRKILEAIAAGVRSERVEPLVEPDRREAIHRALNEARPGDTVLLLGKGHEESILYPDGPLAWNEAEVAAQLLGELGYTA